LEHIHAIALITEILEKTLVVILWGHPVSLTDIGIGE